MGSVLDADHIDGLAEVDGVPAAALVHAELHVLRGAVRLMPHLQPTRGCFGGCKLMFGVVGGGQHGADSKQLDKMFAANLRVHLTGGEGLGHHADQWNGWMKEYEVWHAASEWSDLCCLIVCAPKR